MSNVALVGVVAGITVGSRIVATALIPTPRGPLAETIARLPAPLFAALGAVSLLGADAGPTDPSLLFAVACALVSTRWRSLLVTVVAGLAGYLIAGVLW